MTDRARGASLPFFFCPGSSTKNGAIDRYTAGITNVSEKEIFDRVIKFVRCGIAAVTAEAMLDRVGCAKAVLMALPLPFPIACSPSMILARRLELISEM